jgi:hypothetical protein
MESSVAPSVGYRNLGRRPINSNAHGGNESPFPGGKREIVKSIKY